MLKKLFFFLLGLFAIALIVVLIFGSTLLNKGVESAFTTIGPKVTQTNVAIEAVELSPISGKGSLSGIKIGNPEGYKSENIFELSKIEVDVATKSLLSDTMVIEKVHIKEPKISYEQTMRGSNLTDLQNNIEAFINSLTNSDNAAEAGEKEPEANKPNAKKPKKVVIKDFKVEGGKVYASLMGVGMEIPLPDIAFENIGAKDGPSFKEMGSELYQSIINSVASAGGKSAEMLGDGGKAVLDTTKKQVIDRAGVNLKKLFGN
jgi:uncharacterized protein involved in outer membrane biogenesis